MRTCLERETIGIKKKGGHATLCYALILLNQRTITPLELSEKVVFY